MLHRAIIGNLVSLHYVHKKLLVYRFRLCSNLLKLVRFWWRAHCDIPNVFSYLLQSVLKRKEYERKYDVDVFDDPETGETKVVDREKDEVRMINYSPVWEKTQSLFLLVKCRSSLNYGAKGDPPVFTITSSTSCTPWPPGRDWLYGHRFCPRVDRSIQTTLKQSLPSKS